MTSCSIYAAMEDYALIANASNWRQRTEITCVEPALGMNHIRHNIAERLAVKGASQSVLRIAEGLHDFSTILPTPERKRLRDSLLNEYEEYWNEQRKEWHAEPLYTPEEANWESNAHLRFRLFTFSNFLTTPDTVSAFQKNIEEIPTDAAPGSVLLMIGGKWDHYATIRERMANLAGAGGLQRCNNAVTVASADAQLALRLDEEVRWFYRRLTQLTGDLPTSEPAAADLRKELEGSQPITLKSSAFDAFRK